MIKKQQQQRIKERLRKLRRGRNLHITETVWEEAYLTAPKRLVHKLTERGSKGFEGKKFTTLHIQGFEYIITRIQ